MECFGYLRSALCGETGLSRTSYSICAVPAKRFRYCQAVDIGEVMGSDRSTTTTPSTSSNCNVHLSEYLTDSGPEFSSVGRAWRHGEGTKTPTLRRPRIVVDSQMLISGPDRSRGPKRFVAPLALDGRSRRGLLVPKCRALSAGASCETLLVTNSINYS